MTFVESLNLALNFSTGLYVSQPYSRNVFPTTGNKIKHFAFNNNKAMRMSVVFWLIDILIIFQNNLQQWTKNSEPLQANKVNLTYVKARSNLARNQIKNFFPTIWHDIYLHQLSIPETQFLDKASHSSTEDWYEDIDCFYLKRLMFR